MTVPLPYNMTEFNNITGILSLTQTVSSVFMMNLFGVGILVSFFAITMMSFVYVTQNGGKSFVASAFLTLAVAVLLFTISLITPVIFYSTLIISAISIAFVKVKE